MVIIREQCLQMNNLNCYKFPSLHQRNTSPRPVEMNAVDENPNQHQHHQDRLEMDDLGVHNSAAVITTGSF